MSVIGKKPFVEKIIESCSSEQISTIISLMNNLGTPTEVSLFGNQNLLSESNKGVSRVAFRLNELERIIVNGILVYIDSTHCGLFGMSVGSDIVSEFEIDPINFSYKEINEYLTIEELRQVCGDSAGGGSDGSSNIANIYTFQEGDELTTEIYNSLKNGDIVVVDNYPFVITKVEHTAEYEGDDDYVSVEGTYTINPESAMASITKRIVWNSQPLNGNLFIENGRTYPNVFYFQNGDELTEEIYNQLQEGDMIYGANTNEICTITRKDSHFGTYSIQGYGIRNGQDNILFSTLEWYSDDENGLTITEVSASGSGDGQTLYVHKVSAIYNVDYETHPERIYEVNFKVILPIANELTTNELVTTASIQSMLEDNMFTELRFFDGANDYEEYMVLGNSSDLYSLYLLKGSDKTIIYEDVGVNETIYCWPAGVAIIHVADEVTPLVVDNGGDGGK